MDLIKYVAKHNRLTSGPKKGLGERIGIDLMEDRAVRSASSRSRVCDYHSAINRV